MSQRNTIPASILSLCALATLCLLAGVITAQRNTPAITKASQLSLTNATTWSTTAVPVPGAPLKGVDVKLGKNPGGSPAARTLRSDDDGKVHLGFLAAGSYWLTIEPLTDAQRLANGYLKGQMDSRAAQGTVRVVEPQNNSRATNGDDDDYLAVTITVGDSSNGKTLTRSLNVKNWKFVLPPPKNAAARTGSTPVETYSERIEFEVHPPGAICETTIIRSKSNICNN